jgi:hypothetical protein
MLYRQKIFPYALDERLGGFQAGLDELEKEKISPFAGNRK